MENVIRMHGTGHAGRLPPVVSSLFSIKAAHWGDAIEFVMDGGRQKTPRSTARWKTPKRTTTRRRRRWAA